MSWGLLPQDVIEQLRKREWDHAANLRKRLLGERALPIRIGLKPPAGSDALADLQHFQSWIDAWRQWPAQAQLNYEQRNYRQIGRHTVPITITMASIEELALCLGAHAVARQQHWACRMAPVLEIDETLYPVLVRNLASVESLSCADAQLLARALEQLRPQMGRGLYLRALPIKRVDTKFVELHQQLLADLLDQQNHGAVSAAGGLRAWLGCCEHPRDWLHVRPLCPLTTARLAGLAILRLPSEVLLQTPLPAKRILIIENVQSGLALPPLADTIAVFGGGNNLRWTQTHWLSERRVAYWGDIDTWGLKFLSDVRQRVATIDALMMDRATLDQFAERAVIEPSPYSEEPTALRNEERALYHYLRSGCDGARRLEQERLDADYINAQLRAWAPCSDD